jgi:hypothetical protein
MNVHSIYIRLAGIGRGADVKGWLCLLARSGGTRMPVYVRQSTTAGKLLKVYRKYPGISLALALATVAPRRNMVSSL